MVFAFDFRISVSSEGTVKSPKLISSSSDAGVFWVGHELGIVSIEAQNSRRSSISFTHISITVRWKVGKGWNWLIIWIEFSLFTFYTLGITVTAKSHWFPQLLPVVYKCYFWNVCLEPQLDHSIDWVPKSFNFSHFYS